MFSSNPCVICNSPLTILEARMGKTCGKPMCRLKYSAFTSEQLCRACGRPLSTSQMAEGLCADKNCQTERMIRQSRERMKVEALERAEQEADRIRVVTEKLRLIRDRLAPTIGIENPASYSLVVIPNLSVPVVEVSGERRQEFRKYLLGLLKYAQINVSEGRIPQPSNDSEAHDPPLPPEVRAVLGAACGQCNGDCCRNGGNHAYLTEESMTTYVARHPELSFDQIVDSYLNYIPDGINQDSCLFHRPTGCSLTRDMRGDICNQFFCKPLVAFRNEATESGRVQGCFGATKTYEFKSVAIIDATGVRQLPTELPQTGDQLQST